MPQENRGRRSIRLRGYDYTAAGAYFITICTQDRECLFGHVKDASVHYNPFGKIAAECWQQIPDHFPNVRLDEWVVMPNHVHGIIVIVSGTHAVGRTHASPLRVYRGPDRGSIGAIVGSYKSAVTKRINVLRGKPGERVWQREYHDRIIRNDDEWERIRWYIRRNPEKWDSDRNNPVADP